MKKFRKPQFVSPFGNPLFAASARACGSMGEDAIIETMEKVVFDTDIGSDVNGTLALAC